MIASHAAVTTEHASRYLQQLCKHWSHKFEAEFDEKAGTIRFDAERSLKLASKGPRLTMDLSTPDEETNRRMQAVVGEHRKRFAFREDLVIDWTMPERGEAAAERS